MWAPLEHGVDGICIDATAAVWCATERGREWVREGGEVAESVPFDLVGFSTALGGGEGPTLCMVAAEWNGYQIIGKGLRTGHVHTVDVRVPALNRSTGAPSARGGEHASNRGLEQRVMHAV